MSEKLKANHSQTIRSVDTLSQHTVSAAIRPIDEVLDAVRHADDVLLADLGYKAEFKREFSVGTLIPLQMDNSLSRFYIIAI